MRFCGAVGFIDIFINTVLYSVQCVNRVSKALGKARLFLAQAKLDNLDNFDGSPFYPQS